MMYDWWIALNFISFFWSVVRSQLWARHRRRPLEKLCLWSWRASVNLKRRLTSWSRNTWSNTSHSSTWRTGRFWLRFSWCTSFVAWRRIDFISPDMLFIFVFKAWGAEELPAEIGGKGLPGADHGQGSFWNIPGQLSSRAASWLRQGFELIFFRVVIAEKSRE